MRALSAPYGVGLVAEARCQLGLCWGVPAGSPVGVLAAEPGGRQGTRQLRAGQAPTSRGAEASRVAEDACGRVARDAVSMNKE